MTNWTMNTVKMATEGAEGLTVLDQVDLVPQEETAQAEVKCQDHHQVRFQNTKLF